MIFENYHFTDLLNFVLNLFYGIYESAQEIYVLFTQPLAITIRQLFDNFSGGNELVGVIMETILNDSLLSSLFGEYSLIQFMLGAGIGLYLLWQIVTWILNVIT